MEIVQKGDRLTFSTLPEDKGIKGTELKRDSLKANLFKLVFCDLVRVAGYVAMSDKLYVFGKKSLQNFLERNKDNPVLKEGPFRKFLDKCKDSLAGQADEKAKDIRKAMAVLEECGVKGVNPKEAEKNLEAAIGHAKPTNTVAAEIVSAAQQHTLNRVVDEPAEQRPAA